VLVVPPRLGYLPLVLTLLAVAAWLLWPDGSPSRDYRVPTPIAGTRTLAAPLLLELVIDESGSTGQTDPTGRRHTETAAIARWLVRHSENPRDRIGLVRFADQAEAHAPVPAARAGQSLTAAFGAGSGSLGGGTRLAPAVAAVEDELRPHHGYRRVVVVLSDGQIGESERELQRLLTRLRAAADSVYLVGLDGDGAWTRDTHRLYENRGLGDVLTLDTFAPNAFAQTLAEIVLRETGQRVRPQAARVSDTTAP
jgi:hypothetical protein